MACRTRKHQEIRKRYSLIQHIDVEYEWLCMGAKTKVPIPGKYVNEVSSGRIQEDNTEDQKYQSEIIARIL